MSRYSATVGDALTSLDGIVSRKPRKIRRRKYPQIPRRNAIPIRSAMRPPPRPRRSRRRSPPALLDDAMREIFLRLPPENLASLVRAAAVCKNWRGILSDAALARLYRAFHGPTPMLGFLYNSCYYFSRCVSRFVSVASSSCPPGCRDHRDWYVLDSRHGRILFCTPRAAEDFVVCDPMTDAQWKIPPNPRHSAVLFDHRHASLTWNAAVLCSNNGCDHLDCRGGPFLVVFVGCDEAEGITFATVYSSEAGEWSETIYVDQPNAISKAGHSVLLGNKVYFPCERATRIVEYNYNVGEQELRVIHTPFQDHLVPLKKRQHLVLMTADDGMLLFTGLSGSKLHLLSMEAGAVAWARCRVIELKPLLPIPPRSVSTHVSVVGAVEGASVIFLSTEAGLFSIDLNSGRSKWVHRKTFLEKIIPFLNFYTGVHWRQGAN